MHPDYSSYTMRNSCNNCDLVMNTCDTCANRGMKPSKIKHNDVVAQQSIISFETPVGHLTRIQESHAKELARSIVDRMLASGQIAITHTLEDDHYRHAVSLTTKARIVF